jgi:hypothetical protein
MLQTAHTNITLHHLCEMLVWEFMGAWSENMGQDSVFGIMTHSQIGGLGSESWWE